MPPWSSLSTCWSGTGDIGLSCALRGEPTGATEHYAAGIVAVAKQDLAQGTMLDGEGGATVWGKVIPAARSTAIKAFPSGLPWLPCADPWPKA